jgi:hypothetical protein
MQLLAPTLLFQPSELGFSPLRASGWHATTCARRLLQISPAPRKIDGMEPGPAYHVLDLNTLGRLARYLGHGSIAAPERFCFLFCAGVPICGTAAKEDGVFIFARSGHKATYSQGTAHCMYSLESSFAMRGRTLYVNLINEPGCMPSSHFAVSSISSPPLPTPFAQYVPHPHISASFDSYPPYPHSLKPQALHACTSITEGNLGVRIGR